MSNTPYRQTDAQLRAAIIGEKLPEIRAAHHERERLGDFNADSEYVRLLCRIVVDLCEFGIEINRDVEAMRNRISDLESERRKLKSDKEPTWLNTIGSPLRSPPAKDRRILCA
jgi:hypothetical protein